MNIFDLIYHLFAGKKEVEVIPDELNIFIFDLKKGEEKYAFLKIADEYKYVLSFYNEIWSIKKRFWYISSLFYFADFTIYYDSFSGKIYVGDEDFIHKIADSIDEFMAKLEWISKPDDAECEEGYPIISDHFELGDYISMKEELEKNL